MVYLAAVEREQIRVVLIVMWKIEDIHSVWNSEFEFQTFEWRNGKAFLTRKIYHLKQCMKPEGMCVISKLFQEPCTEFYLLFNLFYDSNVPKLTENVSIFGLFFVLWCLYCTNKCLHVRFRTWASTFCWIIL